MLYTHKKFKTSIKSWIRFETIVITVIQLLHLNKRLGYTHTLRWNISKKKVKKSWFFLKADECSFEKTMENVRKYGNHLVSEPNYHTKKNVSHRKCVGYRNEKNWNT